MVVLVWKHFKLNEVSFHKTACLLFEYHSATTSSLQSHRRDTAWNIHIISMTWFTSAGPTSAALGHNTNSLTIANNNVIHANKCWPILSAHTHTYNNAAVEGWYHTTCGASELCSCRVQEVKRARDNDRLCVYTCEGLITPLGEEPIAVVTWETFISTGSDIKPR